MARQQPVEMILCVRWLTRQHDCWLPRHRRCGCPLAARWLMRHKPTGDCWQEPTKALWFPEIFSKNIKNFNMLSSTGGMAFRRTKAYLIDISRGCRTTFSDG